MEEAGPGWVRVGGRRLLNFSANDYLGLAHHPALAARAAAWGQAQGTGAGASRLITGTREPHLAVERRIAALKGTEAALLFASGWQANAAVLPALLRLTGPETLVFSDALNHASLIEGMRAARRRPILFRHNDLDDLEAKLRAHGAARRLIVTETVFSMDGDVPDLPRLGALARAHAAMLYLDEAHATGALGPGGAGLAARAGGAELVMGTCSKALGAFGGYVAGSQALIDYLANACSGFVYTTALPPPVLGAIDAALDLLPELEAARAHLAAQSAALREALAAQGIPTGASTTHIVPAIIGEETAALAAAARLREAGFLALPIRPPTVPAGTSRLRLALSAAHDAAAVAGLAAALARALPRLGHAA